MMVENAERFGLAQLHQLRGRVGRGNLQSYCIFMSGKKDKDTMERLNVLEKSNDGFYIAGEDLKMRGPGDFFGIRQSGELMFKVGDIYNHADMLRAAQDVYDRYGQEIDAKLINKGDDQAVHYACIINKKRGYTMKNKKTIVMGIIIGILLIIIAVMGYVIASGKKGDSVKKETLQETSAGTEEVKSADNTGDTTVSSEKQDDQSLDIAGDFYAEIGHDTTWEADGKKCATESINIYNNTSASAKDWKLEITYKGTPAVDQIWGGEYKISGKTVSIKAVDYTQEIPAKGSINLGYNFSSDDLAVEKYVLYVNDTQYSGDGLKMVASAPEKTDSNETSGGGKNTESAATEKKNNTNVPGEIPFETHGKLSVKGTDIVDMNGDKYQLKGVSTHGITWFPDYVNKEAFETLRDDWGANLIRLAMYTDTGDSYGYCSGGDKDEILALVDKGVSAATELGMYVIVDWHILSDSDPNNHIDDAKEFFDKVSKKYAAQENVIYEICDEPNGGTQWSSVKSYAETIIPVIRANDKDALIIVGTPNWSQDVDIASQDPITGYDNIMYAVHFYAATHKDDLRNKVKTALDNGLPVFVSEFSLCDASGNGGIDYDSSDEWFKLINENNLSYSSWSLCNKNETSALIKSDSTATGSLSDGDLSDTGKYVRDRIMGK